VVLLNVTKITGSIAKYKNTIKKHKITHQEVADYTGHSRENITLSLNGKTMPLKTALHISAEIEELIEQHSNSFNKLKNSKRYE